MKRILICQHIKHNADGTKEVHLTDGDETPYVHVWVTIKADEDCGFAPGKSYEINLLPEAKEAIPSE
jgi:hypothetical protein